MCEQYDQNQKLNSSFYCLNYCCGTCHFNYCCTNKDYSLNQLQCRNIPTTSSLPDVLTNESVLEIRQNKTIIKEYVYDNEIYTEACGLFKDKSGTIFQAKRCSLRERLCCGSCEDRYCCNSTNEHLNQLDCKIIAITAESPAQNS